MAGEVRYQPTEQDMVGAQRDWFAARCGGWKLLKSAGLAALFSVPLILVIGVAFGDDLSALVWPAIFISTCAIIGVLASRLLTWLLIPWRAHKLFRQQRTLHKEFSYGWSDEGLAYATDKATGQIAWSDLHRWAIGRAAFLFYVSDNLFHFLPRRAFRPDQEADLEETAERYGPRRA